jgi:chorismate dehydratase
MAAEGDQPLRLAPKESPAEIARRLERDLITAHRERETELGHSLKPFRVGSVRYLNAVPLTRGLEDEVYYDVPSKLAVMLQRDELDAALLSVTEVLFSDRYDVLDGIAIASLGEVKSVLLAHRRPLEEVTEVYCDPASLTSLNLLKVLLAERGLRPAFKPLTQYVDAAQRDFVLLIGDPALDFLFASNPHQILDLGAAWFEMTRLPFVYAVWALRRGMDNASLRRQLTEAKAFGMDTLEHTIRSRTEYTPQFRADYLGWHIHYHLGQDERRGLQKFMELLRRHGLGPIHEPRFVS